MKKHVIIVAGGIGKRMMSDIPKQFLCLDGIPILIRSISAFKEYDHTINIVLVLPDEHICKWEKLCITNEFNTPYSIASAGYTRFHSVKNGLKKIEDDYSLIAIHDSVRPLVSKRVIEKIFDCAEINGSAIPYIKINDSLRIKTETSTIPFDRGLVLSIQTPQCFRSELLKKAYEQNYIESFTDDATVVEKLGEEIHLVEGDQENIKITTPKDILIAEALLRRK